MFLRVEFKEHSTTAQTQRASANSAWSDFQHLSVVVVRMGDIHASSILTLIHTCCAASPLRLQLPIPMLLLKSLYHPIVIVSSNHAQSKSLKSIFQESQLLEHCLEMMPFLLDTLAKGTNYVNEFRKLAGMLSCQ